MEKCYGAYPVLAPSLLDLMEQQELKKNDKESEIDALFAKKLLNECLVSTDWR